MANVDNFQSVYTDHEQRGKKNGTKVLIIASVDEDDDKILSYLNPTTSGTVVLNLNDQELLDIYSNNNKRSLLQLVKNFSL